MRRIKAQVDRELSGVRVGPELRRRLMAAAERESRRQRRLRSLSMGLGVAGLAAALALVCGLAMLTRGFHLSPNGAPGDPVQPLSRGQAQQTGAPPLSNPGETPAQLLPTDAQRGIAPASRTPAPTEAQDVEVPPAATPPMEDDAGTDVSGEPSATEENAVDGLNRAGIPEENAISDAAPDESASGGATASEVRFAGDIGVNWYGLSGAATPEENAADATPVDWYGPGKTATPEENAPDGNISGGTVASEENATNEAAPDGSPFGGAATPEESAADGYGTNRAGTSDESAADDTGANGHDLGKTATPEEAQSDEIPSSGSTTSEAPEADAQHGKAPAAESPTATPPAAATAEPDATAEPTAPGENAAETEWNPDDGQLAQAVADMLAGAESDGDMRLWKLLIEQLLTNELGLPIEYVEQEGLSEEFAAYLRELYLSTAREAATVLFTRLSELNAGLGLNLADKQLIQAVADMQAVAKSDGDMQAWLTPIGQILTDELGIPAEYVKQEGLSEEFAAYLRALCPVTATALSARLSELSDELGLDLDEQQLMQATVAMLSVAESGRNMQAWLTPIEQILTDELGLPADYVAKEGLTEEFAAYLQELYPVTSQAAASVLYGRLALLNDNLGLNLADKQLIQTMADMLSVAESDTDMQTWPTPIGQILTEQLGLPAEYVKQEGLAEQFAEYLRELYPVTSQAAASLLYGRLAELNDALGLNLADKQLIQAMADMHAVAASDRDIQAWMAPIEQILTEKLGLPVDYVKKEGLTEEFAAYLSEWQSEPVEEVGAQAFAYDMDGQTLVQLALDLPDAEAPPQGVMISLRSPRERALAGSLQSAARPDAQADYPVRYQFCCAEQGKYGVRVLCVAVLDAVPTDGTTVDVTSGAGEALAQRVPLTIGDADGVRAFAMGLSDSGAYADGVRIEGAADVRVTESAVLLSAPIAVLSVRLTESRLVCWDDSGSAIRHVSAQCLEMPHAPDKTLTPDQCDIAGAEPCPACMPGGESAYAWAGWTVAEGPFMNCAVVPCADGAQLFGWMPLEEFAGYARQIGGQGTLDMTLAGSRGAGAKQYDWLQLSFQNRMTADALRDVQAYEQAAPGYAAYMGLSE